MAIYLIRAKTVLVLSVLLLVSHYLSPQILASSEESNQNSVELRIKKAVESIEARLYRDAEGMLQHIIKEDSSGKYEAYFLLGRIYLQEEAYDKAEENLKVVADNYTLLRDYADKLLMDVYASREQYEKVIDVSRLIRSPLLLKDAEKAAIDAYLSLDKKDEAVNALKRYAGKYRDDWDYKLKLAGLYEELGDSVRAIEIYKSLYIEDVTLSDHAFRKLKINGAEILTWDEKLKRTANLFNHHRYRASESAYKSLIGAADDKSRSSLEYKLGMSQFRQKKYKESAISFARIKTSKAMYWSARSYYRVDDRNGFERVKKELERNYPSSERLALLYLMEAEEFRRGGKIESAEKSYTQVLKRFSSKAEDALWGLAWMNYMYGRHGSALDYFSQLTKYPKSKEFYKYLYWKARNQEKLFEKCSSQKSDVDDEICDKKGGEFFSGLDSNETFYGYLIKIRSGSSLPTDSIVISRPAKPEGGLYDRIEVLMMLGMTDEALLELDASFRLRKKDSEYRYLGYLSMELEEYKRVIAFAEPRSEAEFLPYSYPLAYWDSILMAANKEGIDAYLIAALIREESRFDRKIMSWAGAVGLMQLMPSTAKRMGRTADVRLRDNSELMDSRKNILLGSHYLSRLINEFKSLPFAVAAYNAGENRLGKWLARFNNKDMAEFIENIPYKETRRYVKKVMKSYWQYRRINGLPALDLGDAIEEDRRIPNITPVSSPLG